MSVLKWNVYTKNNEYRSPYLGITEDEKWSGDFFFVQGADSQFGMKDAYTNPLYDKSKADWTFEIDLAKKAVEKVNSMDPKPRFFIICGDMTDEFPEGSEDLSNRQKEDFKKIFSQIHSDIPLVCVCGNHDVGNTPTVDSIVKYRDTYGDDYFSFWCGGIYFIVLNSQLYKNPQHVEKIAHEQDTWLDRQLEKAKGNRIVCFSHIPWFVTNVDENETIFNIPIETRKKLLEKLVNAGVKHFFCGHCHRNGGGYYKEMELVITSAIGLQLGSDGSGFRIVNVSKDNLTHTYVNF